MNILVTDPANSTGYAILQIDDSTKEASIIDYGFIDIESKTYEGDQYIELISRLTDLINKYDIKEVTVEAYFFSGRFANGCNLNAGYRAVIHLMARQLGLPYTILNISSWKIYINGRTTATKEQKVKWGKEPAKKLMTQESLWKKWGIKFPNHSLSPDTGKPIKPRSDIVDAVAMAIYFATQFKHATKIKCLVPIPKDVVWKKIPKGIYSY
jgi:Holliday junction resolvasome RuvABC endonuclease subunit